MTPPLAHAADWLITAPALLVVLWGIVWTLRERRRDPGADEERDDGDEPPGAEPRDG